MGGSQSKKPRRLTIKGLEARVAQAYDVMVSEVQKLQQRLNGMQQMQMVVNKQIGQVMAAVVLMKEKLEITEEEIQEKYEQLIKECEEAKEAAAAEEDVDDTPSGEVEGSDVQSEDTGTSEDNG
jgi:aerobic-type carbon monoxide dehydrogenase small subunit (CoxS/CutS family)